MQPFSNIFTNPYALLALTAWTLPWKGVALWRAARLRDKWWFIVIVALNTFAVLEILYIYYFSKRASLAFSNPEK